MEIPQKTKHRTTIWSSSPTPGHLPRENLDSKRHMYFNVHCSIVCNIQDTQMWKQPECPSTEEWIKKMWFIYTMEYYSAIKRNEIPAFLATWIDLEIIMLSELSQTMRHQHQMLSPTCGIWKKTQWISFQNRYWLTDFEKLMGSKGDRLRCRGMRGGFEMEML